MDDSDDLLHYERMEFTASRDSALSGPARALSVLTHPQPDGAVGMSDGGGRRYGWPIGVRVHRQPTRIAVAGRA